MTLLNLLRQTKTFENIDIIVIKYKIGSLGPKWNMIKSLETQFTIALSGTLNEGKKYSHFRILGQFPIAFKSSKPFRRNTSNMIRSSARSLT